jgi:hypothetical protein
MMPAMAASQGKDQGIQAVYKDGANRHPQLIFAKDQFLSNSWSALFGTTG